MLSRGKCLVIFLSFASIISLASAETAARITQSIDSRRMATLRDNVHPMARPEYDQGALDPGQKLQRVTLVFQRSAEQQQALDKLIEEQQDPNSPNYHKWLTPAEFGARFGLADADLAKAKDWLTSQGFKIEEVPQGKGSITFSGYAGQIATAFQTELHQYRVNGEVHYANAISPSVPSALAGVVAGIRSLNDFKPRPRGLVRRVNPKLTSGISGSHFIVPDDLAAIYNLKGLYSGGIDGSGQKIAVVGQSDLTLAKIATFRSLSGLPASVPTVILVPGSSDPGSPSGDVDEAHLDVEWAGAVARKAQIIYVNSGNGAFDSLMYAINNNVAPVVSVSYGECEPDAVSSGDINTMKLALQQGAGQGQTIVGPSGDDGAADCDFSTSTTTINSATHGLAVDFPGSSPFVTSIGGTTFNEGSGTYWNASSSNTYGSAFFYIPEEAWNDTTASVAANNGLAATGGGASTAFTKPSWQVGTGVPNDGVRDVPDVSFNASTSNDEFIICSQGDCNVCFPGASGQTADPNCPTSSSPGFRQTAAAGNSQWSFDVVGGTSAGVPVFAGLVALINQKIGTNQGALNSRLYQLASSTPYVFHDIPSGSDNKVPCTAGTKDCPSGGTIGFSTGTGYDLVTGLGSVDGFNLVSNWNSAGAADFGVAFLGSAVTVAKGSSVTVPLTVQRQNNFNGQVTLSCTSSVASITCSLSPGTVNPDGTSTVTIAASASASNSHAPLMPWLASTFGVAALFGMSTGKRGKKSLIVFALLALALILGLAACGGGSSSSSSGNNNNGGGTGTTGTVTVTATSGSLSHTSQIAVTVQ